MAPGPKPKGRGIAVTMSSAFDWSRLTWSRPDSRAPVVCSYCFGELPEVPFMMFKESGAAVSFCDGCAELYLRMARAKP